MTINGPAPMLLAYFMNAAVDQECEMYIKEHGLESNVEAVKKAQYDDRGIARPAYQGELPEGNDGLGLLLLKELPVMRFLTPKPMERSRPGR